jgi:branched-chain amino acid transport system permease protein
MGGSKMDIKTNIGGSRLSRKTLIVYGVLLVAAMVLPIVFQYYGNAFMVRIFALVGIYILLSLGLNIVVGYAGLLDLGYIAFYGMGAYVGVLLGYVFQGIFGGAGGAMAGFSYWFLLIPAALAGALTGVALGTPVLRLRGDYLAIVTLGFGEIVRIALTNNIGGLTGGSAGLPRVGEIIAPAAGQKWVFLHLSNANFTFSKDLFWYFVIVMLCFVAVFVIRRLDNSRLGRAWVAMREDEVAAASMGVNIMQTKLWAFSLGAMWGGVAGITYAYWVGFISPESFNFMESVLVVCMVVLGGMGSIQGAALGAVIIVGLPEIIRYVAASPMLSGVLSPELASAIGDYRFLLFGGAMVVMMALRPQGIMPSQRRARELTEADVVIEEENESLWEVEHKHDTPHGL